MMGPPGWAGFFYEVEMNLKDMRDMVGNILDYNPNVAAYNTELNRIINEVYLNFYLSQPWTFAQQTLDVYSHPDTTDTAATIAQNTGSGKFKNKILNCTNIAKPFREGLINHEGDFLVISNAANTDDDGLYVIDKVDLPNTSLHVSKLSSNLQHVNWQSGGLSADTITAEARAYYLRMPKDCSQILSVGIRNIDEAGSGRGNALGHAYELTRKRDEELDLRIDMTGTPVNWVPYDMEPNGIQDATRYTPRAIRDFTVTTTGLTPGWPAGTYEFKMSYVWRGVESQLSDPFELTIGTNQIPVFNTNDTTSQGVFGRRKKFYVRLKSVTGKDGATTFSEDFYRDLSQVFIDSAPITAFPYVQIDDDNTAFTWPMTSVDMSALEDLMNIPRAKPDITTRWRIRLFPRPAEITPIRVRYIAYPSDLLDDFDVPKSPHDTHRYLVYRACQEFFMKHDNQAKAVYYERKADKELQMIENKHLTQRSAYYIKEGFKTGPLRVRPFQTLTKTTGADGA